IAVPIVMSTEEGIRRAKLVRFTFVPTANGEGPVRHGFALRRERERARDQPRSEIRDPKGSKRTQGSERTYKLFVIRQRSRNRLLEEAAPDDSRTNSIFPGPASSTGGSQRAEIRRAKRAFGRPASARMHPPTRFDSRSELESMLGSFPSASRHRA